MVKKLMKYELASYMRSLLPFQLILLGIALLHRFVQLFENDGDAYWTFFSSSTAIFIIACIVTLVATVALCIARFYKNMFTGEGYLSFTLPVTVHQHIWAKLLSAIICALVSAVAILLACSIVTAGDAFVELWKAICYLCNRAFDNIGGHFIAYIIAALLHLHCRRSARKEKPRAARFRSILRVLFCLPETRHYRYHRSYDIRKTARNI